MSKTARYTFTGQTAEAVADIARAYEAERDALAARVEELKARIARADKALGFRWWGTETPAVAEARRILRGEDDTS